MFLEAVGYSFGALRSIHQVCAPSDAYWNRRILLNLMLANAGLYFTSLVHVRWGLRRRSVSARSFCGLGRVSAGVLLLRRNDSHVNPQRLVACDLPGSRRGHDHHRIRRGVVLRGS
jgi:hypothetical protein